MADPVVTPIDDPFVKRIATIAESFAGKRPSITPIAGGTLPFLGDLRRYVGVLVSLHPITQSIGEVALTPQTNISGSTIWIEPCVLDVIYLWSWETSGQGEAFICI